MLSGSYGPRWLAQDERPAHVGAVDFADLPVALRLLLNTDGTLLTALEAYQLGPVRADVAVMEELVLDETHARWLHSSPGATGVHRRSALRAVGSGRLLVQADVVLLPYRLPMSFLSVLAESGKGLGEAFDRLRVQTGRDLLWFGRAPLAGLSDGDRVFAGATGVARCYRLVVGSTPVCTVQETFPDAVVAGAP